MTILWLFLAASGGCFLGWILCAALTRKGPNANDNLQE